MVWLDQLMRIEGHERGEVDAVIISTVVPRALHNLQLLAVKYFGVDAPVAGREPVTWGIALQVDEPQSVGADRAVNAISSQSAGPATHKPVLTFGTAPPLDPIRPTGPYLGPILPPVGQIYVGALGSDAATRTSIGPDASAST